MAVFGGETWRHCRFLVECSCPINLANALINTQVIKERKIIIEIAIGLLIAMHVILGTTTET